MSFNVSFLIISLTDRITVTTEYLRLFVYVTFKTIFLLKVGSQGTGFNNKFTLLFFIKNSYVLKVTENPVQKRTSCWSPTRGRFTPLLILFLLFIGIQSSPPSRVRTFCRSTINPFPCLPGSLLQRPPFFTLMTKIFVPFIKTPVYYLHKFIHFI